MITKEEFMDIIALHRQGLSMRAIARKLGMHRNTVKKYIEGGTMPGYGQSSSRPSIIDPYRQLIDDYLAEDDYQATWLHDRLLHLGYQGSYKTVQEYVRTVKDRRTRLAYSRFETEPGLQAQIDWGDFQIANPDGTTTTVYLFLMVLGFSRTLYLEFVDRCTLEAFLDCHKRAFAFFQGVPAEILYDNMKHVVIGRSGKPQSTGLLSFCRRLQGVGDVRHRPVQRMLLCKQDDNTADSVSRDSLPSPDWGGEMWRQNDDLTRQSKDRNRSAGKLVLKEGLMGEASAMHLSNSLLSKRGFFYRPVRF